MMNDMNVSPISAAEKNVANSNLAQINQDRVIEKTSERQPVEERTSEVANMNDQPVNSLKDVELKFVPDVSTNEVTVFVVDRTSKSVLRTIPPEELKKLDSGDLLKITA